jgi:SET domain-containing protein
MPIESSDLIHVKQARGKGRGVFARQFIPEGTVFERVPVLVIPEDEILEQPGMLSHYVFEWGKGTVALALGFGSMYNHSFNPNARYDDVGRQTKIFTALRDISAGEEVTINYNGDESDQSPVGFDVQENEAAELNGVVAFSE